MSRKNRAKQGGNLNALLQKYLQKQQKEQLVKSLPPEAIESLSQTMACMTFASEIEINEQKNDPLYKNTLKLLRKSKKEKLIDPELTILFNERRAFAKNHLHLKRGHLAKQILSDQYENFKKIKKTRPEVALKLLTSKLATTTIHLREMYERVTSEIEIFEFHPMQIKLNQSLLVAEVKDHDILTNAAFLILNPKNQFLSALCTEKESEELPFWYINQEPINVAKTLIFLHRKGVSLESYFTEKYAHPSGFERIVEQLDNPYLNMPTTHLLCSRKNIIREILDCHAKKMYSSSVCTSLVLIEGLIWDFSKEMHLRHGEIYTDENFSILKLNSGKTQADPTIGLLLQQSKLGELFDKKFVTYFCNELYSERNPILHGRDLSNFTEKNSSKKIATIEYLLNLIMKKYEFETDKKIDQTLSEETKTEIKKLLKKNFEKLNLQDSSPS